MSQVQKVKTALGGCGRKRDSGLASHDSNPYPNYSRIARYNAAKPDRMGGVLGQEIAYGRERWGGAKEGRTKSCQN